MGTTTKATTKATTKTTTETTCTTEHTAGVSEVLVVMVNWCRDNRMVLVEHNRGLMVCHSWMVNYDGWLMVHH